MNKLLKSFLLGLCAAVFIFGTIYLLSSFVNMTFDFTEWDNQSRGVVAILGGMIGCIVGVLVAGITYDD